MASRFRRQPPNVLEIRGVSRGSIVDHPHLDSINDMMTNASLSKECNMYNSDSDDDDDESTIVGGSIRMQSLSPQSPTHSNGTITTSDASHYWSAGNSFTTGNTTERSSVYSWGDDEFDLQTSRMVRGMFLSIERMLFEGVLSGSTSLQQECKEWMDAFPHLRVSGKQMFTLHDDGYESVVSPSRRTSFQSTPQQSSSEVLEVYGSGITPISLPLSSDTHSENESSVRSDVPHLFEEIFAQDGSVEEYLAYDIREMDDEENHRKYHVPRRRRLGFPPITPNACVRDSVLQQIFDLLWSRIVACFSHPIKNKSLIKLLVENEIRSHHSTRSVESSHSAVQLNKVKLEHDSNHTRMDDDQHTFGIRQDVNNGNEFYHPLNMIERNKSTSLNFGSFFASPVNSRSFYPDSMGLPQSRGFTEQSVPGKHLALNRTPTTPLLHNSTDISSLNDVMKISQKKLQTRADRTGIDDVSPDVFPDAAIRFPPTILNDPHNPTHQSLNSMGSLGISSPFPVPQRHPTLKETPTRQQSGQARKGRGARSRLAPLERSKTLSVDHNHLNVKATKLIPTPLDSATLYGGLRISSPSNSFQPPPTAPNPSIGTGTLWANTINSRLPPIPSNLEALPENSLSEFKKNRGRTAFTRISSAVGDDKLNSRMFEGISRPNTTHTFRTDNLPPKRASSLTPSNHMISVPTPALKSISPAGVSHFLPPGGGLPFPFQSTGSPDPRTGLSGITGKSINFIHSSSPDDGLGPLQSSFGSTLQSNPSIKKKRPPLL